MLNELNKVIQKNKKRIGRGYGSGKGGHTVGRGMKGQKSRSGYKLPRRGFEGGQMPLSRRIPKLKGFTRGYYTHNKKEVIISLDDLNSFKKGEVVTIKKLVDAGIINTKSKTIDAKILSNGSLEKEINIEGIKVSKSAAKVIEAKGGKIS